MTAPIQPAPGQPTAAGATPASLAGSAAFAGLLAVLTSAAAPLPPTGGSPSAPADVAAPGEPSATGGAAASVQPDVSGPGQAGVAGAAPVAAPSASIQSVPPTPVQQTATGKETPKSAQPGAKSPAHTDHAVTSPAVGPDIVPVAVDPALIVPCPDPSAGPHPLIPAAIAGNAAAAPQLGPVPDAGRIVGSPAANLQSAATPVPSVATVVSEPVAGQPPAVKTVGIAAPPTPLPEVPQPLPAGPRPAHGAAPPQAAPSLARQLEPAMVQLSQGPAGSAVTLRLDPAGLGHVQVRIDRDTNGAATVQVTAEHPDTLRMLMADQPQLRQALDNAGLAADGRALSFSLAGGGGFGGGLADGAGGRPGGGRSGRALRSPGQADEAAFPIAATWQRAGIDITA